MSAHTQGVVLPDGYTAEVKARERIGSESAAIRLDTVGIVPLMEAPAAPGYTSLRVNMVHSARQMSTECGYVFCSMHQLTASSAAQYYFDAQGRRYRSKNEV